VDGGVVIGVLVGLVAAWAALVALLWMVRPRDVRLGEVVRVVPDVLRLVRDLIADRTVGWIVRIALVVLLVWIVSPIDLIPDFIPVLGPLDDVIVAVLVFRFVARRVGLGDLQRRWRGTAEGFLLLARILGPTLGRT
jgi:uncharacterized membrane protein YkvA (DUF1232 family)